MSLREGSQPDNAIRMESLLGTAMPLLRKFFFNRTDRVAFLAPWGKPCPVEAGDNLGAMLQAHLLGESAPTVTIRWTTGEGKSGTESGRFRLGTYSPRPDGLTVIAIIDCDGGGRHGHPLADPLGAALEILHRLERLGIVAYLERSGSGTGWHIWIFFAVPIPASKVRELLFKVIPLDIRMADSTAADPHKNKGIEVFPKQDKIADNGLGNMVWLPMWHGAAEGGNLFHRVSAEGEIAPFCPDDFATVSLADLEEAMSRVTPSRGRSSAAGERSQTTGRDDAGRVSADVLLQKALTRARPGAAEGRNGTGFWLACQLRDNGYSRAEAEGVLDSYAAAVPQGEHPYTGREARASLEQAYRQSPREPWAKALGRLPGHAHRLNGRAAANGSSGGQVKEPEAKDTEAEGLNLNVLEDLLKQAETDVDAAIDAALSADTLQALARARVDAPGRLEALYRGLKKAGAQSRALIGLQQAVNAERKRLKREKARSARPRQAEPGRVNASPDDQFANFREEESENDDGKVVCARIGLPIQVLSERLHALTKGWPRRVDNLLFVESADGGPLWLQEPPQLFAWVGRQLEGDQERNGLRWAQGHDMVSEGRFQAHLEQTAENFVAVEPFPHWPAMLGHYYLHPQPEGGDGRALRELLEQFCPATLLDYDLIESFFMTPFWGGPPGRRPGFLFTAENDDGKGGRGAGKSTVAQKLARLVGGAVSIDHDDEMGDILKRLLSPGGLVHRVVLLDNLKTLKFSWAQLEALITNDVVSGHRMYFGEARRPNTLIVVITLNGASLSKDMAQRCVIVKVKRPARYDAQWEEKTNDLIDKKRWAIIGDILARLKGPGKTLPSFSRWSAWERDVLSRVAEPEDCQRVICERQGDVDEDSAEADLVRDAFYNQLRRAGHNPEKEVVFVPSAVAAAWVVEATGETRGRARSCSFLYQLGIPEISRGKLDEGRGFFWRGQSATGDAGVVSLKNLIPPFPDR